MKYLSIVILLVFFQTYLSANTYRDVVKISLKKDQTKKILIKYDTIQKLFQFRWTLYKNGGLVIFRSYDRSVAQNILYLNLKILN